MQTRKTKTSLRIDARRYALELRPEQGLALLDVKRSVQRHMFFLGGAVNPHGERDETASFGVPTVSKEEDGALLVVVPQESSAWEWKRTAYVCREDSVEICHLASGKGNVGRAMFGRGYFQGQERGWAGDFDQIYDTCPNFQERLFYHPADSFFISYANNLTPNCGGQALASPCHCMGLGDRREASFLSVGLAAQPGQYTWDDMEWNPPVSIPATGFGPDDCLAGGFAANYHGKEQVEGEWASPRLILAFAPSREKVLPAYLNHCYRRGYLPRPPRRKGAGWWQEPIYCTWHDQVALARSSNDRDGEGGSRSAFEFCTQELTDRWVRLLERRNCKPGIVILDARWQKHLNTADPLPERWPDLRGWIDECHGRGIRVFVWTAAWSKEGLPEEECVLRDGEPVACDITHPAYEARLREMVRRWFSDGPDGLNADGVKVDGLLSLPSGPGLANHEGLWGLELQRRYMGVMYDEAKKHKKDACISTYVAHPYLARSADMSRIADMYTCRLTAHETMLHRAEVFAQTMPHTVIDTDGQFSHYMPDDYASELAEQAKIGVPTLYCAEWVYRMRFFQPLAVGKMKASDYREFAKVFAAHRARVRRRK